MQYFIQLSFTYLGAAVVKHFCQRYCFEHQTTAFSGNMFFAYCSNLLAFLTNRHSAYTRLWTHYSCNEGSLYPGNIWPVCQCMVSPACLEHMRPTTQTRVSTHTLLSPAETRSALRTQNLKNVSSTFPQIMCWGCYALPCTSGRSHSHDHLSTEPPVPWGF